MHISQLAQVLEKVGISFFTGVPDSLLQPFCDDLMNRYGIDSEHHVVAHNEGGCVALASGYHLATGKVPCVYMQNSGIGNTVNPIASLTHPKVYAIPMLFVVGWRGEPGVKDEPQHVFQGEITLPLLEQLEIASFVLDKEATVSELGEALTGFAQLFAEGKSAALVVKKGALQNDERHIYGNDNTLVREDAVALVAELAIDDIVVSTTGKISRELFEIREGQGMGHGHDFLTVGSMGHSAMIALGVALQKKDRRVWCLDGDGAVLMHMGALSLVGSCQPKNLIHVVLNNCAHETVGGVPTAIASTNLCAVARAAGYRAADKVNSLSEIKPVLEKLLAAGGPVLLEIPVALGSREDLGRPTTTARENKLAFMDYVKGADA